MNVIDSVSHKFIVVYSGLFDYIFFYPFTKLLLSCVSTVFSSSTVTAKELGRFWVILFEVML